VRPETILVAVLIVLQLASIVRRLDGIARDLDLMRRVEEARYLREQQIFGSVDAREDLKR
jgi:hypothetical protein